MVQDPSDIKLGSLGGAEALMFYPLADVGSRSQQSVADM